TKPRKPKHESGTTGLLRTLRCLFSVSQRGFAGGAKAESRAWFFQQFFAKSIVRRALDRRSLPWTRLAPSPGRGVLPHDQAASRCYARAAQVFVALRLFFAHNHANPETNRR